MIAREWTGMALVVAGFVAVPFSASVPGGIWSAIALALAGLLLLLTRRVSKRFDAAAMPDDTHDPWRQ
jgi:hypothetical protein